MSDTHARLRGVSRFLLVAVALVALLGLSSMVLRPKSNHSEYHAYDSASTGVPAEPADSIDVFFVGDSVPFWAISPLLLWGEQGFTSHIVFSFAANPADEKTLLHAISDTQHPRLIVFEACTLYNKMTAEDALMSEAQLIFPVLRYHSRWRALTWNDFTTLPVADWRDPSKGYRPEMDVKPADPKDYDNYMADSDDIEEIPFLSKLYIRYLVDYCRKLGATPVLLSTPSCINWNRARHNAMVAWAAELGIDFIDLNVEPTKVPIDWEKETKDAGDHLNWYGAEKNTHYLGNLLKQRYDLPDHRGDPAYEDWDEAFKSLYGG